MKKFKKRLFGIITFMMLALAVPVVFPGSYGVKEVQAAVKVTAPKLLSAKPYGTNKNRAEMEHGKRCKTVIVFTERRTEENGRQCVIFLDIRQQLIRMYV